MGENVYKQIIDFVGGKENITIFTHCVTRLRFNVKDKGLIDIDSLEELDEVIGTKWGGDQFQIIIGPKVESFYNEINSLLGGIGEISKNNQSNEPEEKKFSFMTIVEAIVGCVIPLIPVFMGTSLVKTLAVLLNVVGILDESTSTYQLLTWAGDAGMYFIPIFAAYTAAKRFGATPVLAMGLVSFLLYPGFIDNVANGTNMNLFGIPVYNGNYTQMIFPAIMIVFVMSYVERFFKKYIPDMVAVMFVPMLTLLVMLPIMLALIAPLGLWIGSAITTILLALYNHLGFIAVGLLSALYPLMVIIGMHTATVPAMIQVYSTHGYDPLVLPSMIIYNFNQAAAMFGVMVRSKNKKTKATALSGGVPALVAGVSEPALFAIALPYKTPLIAAMIGGFVGGMYFGLMSVGTYSAGGLGLASVISFVSERPSNMMHAIIGLVLSMIVTFVVSIILFKDKKGGK